MGTAAIIQPAIGYGGGGRPIGGPTGNSGGGSNGSAADSGIDWTLDVPLPDQYPIPGSTEFNIEADKASAIAQSNVDMGILIDVPQGYRCVVRGVSIYITNMLTTTDVRFNVLTNGQGSPAAGYNALRMFPRVAPFVGNTFDSVIRVNGPAQITVTFSNVDGGSYQVGAALSGWLWPIQLENLWKLRGPVSV